MLRQHSSTVSRCPKNVTLPAEFLEEARALDLNISQACEQGLKAAISSIRAQQWLAENRSSLRVPNVLSGTI